MKVEVLYFEGCPNHKPAVARLQAVLQEQGVPGGVAEIEVPDSETAKDLGFFGSPTIRVNGLDVDPACRNIRESALACRCYPGGGLPSEEMIREALREAQGLER